MNVLDDQLTLIFRRVFRHPVQEGDNLSVGDVEEWNSLTHIKLVMELESEFGMTINPDDILKLFSDTHTIRQFVINSVSAG